MSEPKPAETLPRDKAFYFFTSIGNYTGESAASLEEFTKKTLTVNIKSLEFHLYRGDFEKWAAETLEDTVLANKVRQLRELKPIGMDLRDRLYLIVSKHYESVKKPQPTTPTQQRTTSTSVTFGKPQPKTTVETQTKR